MLVLIACSMNPQPLAVMIYNNGQKKSFSIFNKRLNLKPCLAGLNKIETLEERRKKNNTVRNNPMKSKIKIARKMAQKQYNEGAGTYANIVQREA